MNTIIGDEMLNAFFYKCRRTHQRGAVLIVGLIILLLLTMIALTAMQGTILQERMSSNFSENDKAFNAGAAGTREAENITYVEYKENTVGNAYSTSADITSSRKMPFDLATEDSWTDGTSTTLAGFGGSGKFEVGKSPRYMINYWRPIPLGPSLEVGIQNDIEIFRTAAMGFGGKTSARNVEMSATYRLIP